MTSEVFLKELDSKLDFMSYKDRVKILSFYSDKILAASPEEEQAVIDGFGDIDSIVAKIKVKYEELTEVRSRGDTVSFDPEIINEVKNSNGSENGAASEATRTFGEVKKKEDLNGSEGNGEEQTENGPDSGTRKISNASDNIKLKKRSPARDIHSGSNVKTDKENEIKELWLPDTKGLFGIIMEKLNVSNKARPLVFTGLLIVFTPLLLVLTALLFLLYIASIAVFLAVAAAIFLLVIIPAVIAVVDLSYGIIMLFQNITAALIEIGIGTILFSVVIALIGLGYQLVAGAIPSILKKLTMIYKYVLIIFKTLIFGK